MSQQASQGQDWVGKGKRITSYLGRNLVTTDVQTREEEQELSPKGGL